MRQEYTFGLEGYSDPRPSEGKIQAGYLRGFKILVGNLGGSYQEILENHGLDADAFEDSDYHIACRAAVEILEYGSTALNDPLFGLHLADLQEPDVFGCVAALARAAPTVRQALQSLVDYVPVINSPEGALELVVSGSTAEFRWRSSLDVRQSEQINYHGLLLLMKTLRMLGGEHFHPRYATLVVQAPGSYLDIIQDTVGCKVYPRAAANAICFSSDILELPLHSTNRLLFKLVSGYLAAINGPAKAPFIKQVESFIRATLPTGACTIEHCAERLAIAPRTLQKRLGNRDTSFTELVETQRLQMAKKELREGQQTLGEITYNLGYADQTSFGRAFKRWTGVSPQAYRQRAK
jgi:AraC-like DNA-binding protein